MKTLFLIVTGVLITCAAHCQTVTNWVTAAPNFREVNGQLYNVQRSALFHEIKGVCISTRTNTIGVSTIDETETVKESNLELLRLGLKTGNDFYWHGQAIVLLNYPDATIGARISGYAMRVGTTNLPHGAYELWDYGTPHHIAVITTNSPTL